MDFNLARKKYNNFLQAKEKKINTPHDFGPGIDSKNHRILPGGGAYEQQLARRADPNNKLNRKRAKRKAKQRMAGERMNEMKQQDNYQSQQKMKKDKAKRKDYRMS